MCGVCGVLGNMEDVYTDAMLSAMAHRGPDDCNQYMERIGEKCLWFGHRRLSIIDLSAAARQPMSTTDGTLTITYNGEIYNYHEIRKDLLQRGHIFRTTSDTEVILAAWETWGEDCVHRFRGMFAFGLWDKRYHELWLARDRLGEKPLYYIIQKDRVLFASEVRALLASGVVDRVLDGDGVDSYLTFGSVSEPFTLIKDLRCVPTGHIIKCFEGNYSSNRYWWLGNIEEESKCNTRQDVVEEVRECLDKSMELCMVADVPVGILLSGGIDSSANVVMLAKGKERRLSTFSVIFGDVDSDICEKKWSSLVAKTFDTDHHQLMVTDEKANRWVPEALAAMDQPSRDGINTYLVCRAIKECGIKVGITGQGADELFLGYGQRHRFPWLLGLSSQAWLKGLARAIGGRGLFHDTKFEKLFELFENGEKKGRAYLSCHTIFSQGGLERLRGESRPSQIRFLKNGGGKSALGVLSRLQICNYLRDTLLRDGDQMSMANSVELRAPYLDYRLVELVSGLEISHRVKPRSRQKPLLVDAVGPALPRQIVQRKKTGFVLPYARWIRSGFGITEVRGDDVGLNQTAIDKIRRDFEKGAHPSRYWTLLVLAEWIRKEKLVAQ